MFQNKPVVVMKTSGVTSGLALMELPRLFLLLPMEDNSNGSTHPWYPLLLLKVITSLSPEQL
jgi:hypothetical protein